MTAGGSSGGAACGLSTRMPPVADGGDMMGSLRNPAAFNNVVGFRPTLGRVPEGGEGDLFYLQLAVSGPMGRNSEDAARLLCTMAGSSAHEPLSLRDQFPDAADARERPMGMQVMGPFGEDRAVLEFAMSYESVTAHLDARPRLVEAGAALG